MRIADKLALCCLLTIVPCLRAAAAAGDATVGTIVAEESAIERQTDPRVGPGWPDVSKVAEDRRTADQKVLQLQLSKLAPSPADSEDGLTRRLLDWRLGMRIEAAAKNPVVQ